MPLTNALGVRVDVDTYRGTARGVPELLEIFAAHNVKATFVFSVGPDNMGRHLWRLLRPKFLVKMLRSKAASLYGWDIILKGTVLPGPMIGERLQPIIKAAADAGHEVGLHAWDHHAWQTRIDRYSPAELRAILQRGWDVLREIVGREPDCSAAPAWRATEAALLAKDALGGLYHSDCRGDFIFYPKVNGKPLTRPQVPTSLPSYDELIGRDGVTDATFNDTLRRRLAEHDLKTLAIHAEVEGIAKADLFRDFCKTVTADGLQIVPFGWFVKHAPSIPAGCVVQRTVAGREGWLSFGTRGTEG